MEPGGEEKSSRSEDGGQVVELNIGGVVYSTTRETLTSRPDSLLCKALTQSSVSGNQPALRDASGRCFFDRDGPLFRYVLDFLRGGESHFRLPDDFREINRLRQEAEFFRLPEMVERLAPAQHKLSLPLSTLPGGGGGEWTAASGPVNRDGFAGHSPLRLQSITVKEPGYIVVGYRGSFQFGRDGQADVKFRKLTRILVSGRVSVCREVFQDTLNESRDPDRGTADRYSARFFLKHGYLEQAFDMLQEAGFRMVGSCGSGTSSTGDVKPGVDLEEIKWNHYNEFVFCRP